MEGLLREAGVWIGRKRSLTEMEFRHFYGVYPRTAFEISEMPQISQALSRKWLLRTLWWLKTYPTDEMVKNHQAGDTYLRTKRREVLECLFYGLPEVSVSQFQVE